MDQLKPPGNLDFESQDVAYAWKKWKEEITLYLALATKADEKERKVKFFLYLIGSKGREIYETMQFQTEEKDRTLDELIKSFGDYCDPKKNETVERHKFFTRNQEPGETFDKYLTELRLLEKTCDFGTLADSLLRDRIVCGLSSSNLRERLLREPNLNLKQCIDICRASELSKERNKSLDNTDNVSRIHSRKFTPQSQKLINRHFEFKHSRACLYCGRQHELVKTKCPAYGKTCNLCKEANHFAVCCRKAPNSKPSSSKQVKSFHDDHEYAESQYYEEISTLTTQEDTVYSMDESFQRKLFATMSVNSTDVKFQLDSGATCNVITLQVLQQCNCDAEIIQTNKVLSMYNGTTVKPIGQCKVKMINPKNGCRYLVHFEVLSDSSTPILGSRAIQQMELIKVLQDNIKSVQVNHTTVSKEFLLAEYPKVFEGIGCMPGTYHLTIDSAVVPVVHPPRKVPLSMKEKVEAELKRLTELEIIEPVSKPTQWVSSLVTAPKPNGDIRICIDPKDLNGALQRSHYPIPTMDDILPKLNKAKVFSTVDLKCGFWQVRLDNESADLTTFNTPSGRYRWLRMPFGISSAPEEFQRRQHEAVEGLPGVISVHDDILVYGKGNTEQEAVVDHDKNMLSLMERCKEQNITLNRDKMQLKKSQVRFLGHLLTAKGVQADPEKIRAITEMPNPTDVKGMQRFLGLVNYLSKFLPRLSTVCEPLRLLTLKDTEWCWLEIHDEVLKEIKKLVTNSPVLRYYNPEEELTLQCDASDKGLGAALLQQGQPIAFASRALSACELGYAPIEKELLAVVYGMERFHHYTYGRKVVVNSDHKPLESIVKKPLHMAPKRLQRMLLRLQGYDISLRYLKGTEMFLADTLSRAYLGDEVTSTFTEGLMMIEAAEPGYLSAMRLKDVAEHSKKDPVLFDLEKRISGGWPEKKDEVEESLRPYFAFRDELSVQHGVIYRGERVIVPLTLRKDMIQRLHSSHLGIEGCLRRARVCLYWPGMNAQVKEYIQSCEICLSTGSRQQKETMIPHDANSHPWSKVGLDLFDFNQQTYLVTVDYYSNFFEIDYLASTTSRDVIHKVKAHFSRYGIPDTVISDNGPQFSSEEFLNFSKRWGFNHITSSPKHSQSNGLSESAVKTAKRLVTRALLAHEDSYLSLLDLRNTPTQGMSTSPVERLLNRRTKTMLPTSEKLLQPKLNHHVSKEREVVKEKQVKYYNEKAKDLPPLTTGQTVMIEPDHKGQMWRKANVVRPSSQRPRSYEVEVDSGRVLSRNRKHLRVAPLANTPSSDEQEQSLPEAESERQQKVTNESVPPDVPDVPYHTQSGRVVKKPSYLQDFV